jgi:hypothetical protein
MNFTRQNYRMMGEELLKIVYWKDGDAGSRPRVQDRIEAAERRHDAFGTSQRRSHEPDV